LKYDFERGRLKTTNTKKHQMWLNTTNSTKKIQTIDGF